MSSFITVPVAQWAPDMPAFNISGDQSPRCMTATNVIPATPLSYGPMPSLGGALSNTLSSACRGAYACTDSQGNINIFAGDQNDLYQLSGASATFSKVSKTLGVYTATGDAQWHMALFGNRVIATDYTDNIQSFVMGTSAAFADLTTAIKAKYIAIIKSFLVCAYINDPTYGNGVQPQWVWWSANNDPTNFPTPGGATAISLQSSYNPLYGEGGKITGIVGNLANADGVIFMEHAVWRMVYNGAAPFFSFYPAGSLRGCQASNSIVQVGQKVYFLAEDGFYSYDGVNSVPIGVNRVDKTFYADFDYSNRAKMVGTTDVANKLVIWAYPGVGNSGGFPNRLLVYNWAIDRWSLANISVQFLLRSLSLGYTLDQLYTVLGYTIDTIPYPLGSGVWQGGRVNLAAFDGTNALNFFSGPNLAATVDTAEIQPTPGRRTMIISGRPLVDGGHAQTFQPSDIGDFIIGVSPIGATQPSSPLINIGHRNRLFDPVTYDGPSAITVDGVCPLASDDRYIRAEITTLAGDTWNHMQGVELEINPSSTV